MISASKRPAWSSARAKQRAASSSSAGRLGPPQRGARTRRRLDQRRTRRAPLLGRKPMAGHARRLAVALAEIPGDLAMQLPRDRRRHRGERRLADHVVHERAVAEDLRRLELRPCVDEVQRTHAEHVRCHVGREVLPGDGRTTRQSDRLLRQVPDAAGDQRPDIVGHRQAGNAAVARAAPARP